MQSFFNSFYLRMSLPSLGRVKTQLKWKGYMYAQPFESLYNTNHPIDVCFLLLSVREGLEKGWKISYWEYAHTKSAQVFLLVASSSLVRCGKCSGLLNMYAEIGRYLRPLGKLSLTWFAYYARLRPDDMQKRYVRDSRERYTGLGSFWIPLWSRPERPGSLDY